MDKHKNKNKKQISKKERKAAIKKVHEEYGSYKAERGLPKFVTVHKNSKGSGAKLGFTGRRTILACWHAHGHFFEALLNIAPHAVITVATYKITIDGGNWIDKQIGSIMQPLYYSEACLCDIPIEDQDEYIQSFKKGV